MLLFEDGNIYIFSPHLFFGGKNHPIISTQNSTYFETFLTVILNIFQNSWNRFLCKKYLILIPFVLIEVTQSVKKPIKWSWPPARWSWIIYDFPWIIHDSLFRTYYFKLWIFVHEKKVDEYSWIYFFRNNSWTVILMKLHHLMNVQ